MSSSEPIVGIDLGTTNSAVAILEGGEVRLLPNPLGDVLTPSAVARERRGDKLVVGRTARDVAATDPDAGATRFKLHMGEAWTRTLGGRAVDATELSAYVLDALRADAERALGRPVTRCVVTVPAYFDDRQRHATQRAAELAGWTVERVLNEPTAAAIAYGLHRRADERLFAVVDLGGGTFDVCVMERFEGVLQVRGVAGDGRLGGDDFSAALATHLAATAGVAMPVPGTQAHALLLRRGELAKRALSRWPTTDVDLPPELVDGARRAVTVTRDDAERAWRPLIERLHGPLRAALRGAGVSREELDEIVLVGGATRMPCIQRTVEEIFGRPPVHHGDPDLLVAHGAAIQAALIADDAGVRDLVVTDVASHSLGVGVSHQVGPHWVPGYFSPIIHRNTVIPTSQRESYATLHDFQEALTFDVYEGEGRRVADNRKIGTLRIEGLPRKPKPVEVEVRFTYDHNGMLEVEARIVETGKLVSKVFHRDAGELGGDALEAARRRLRALRADPMDRPRYRDVRARATLLWSDLTADRREELDAAIDAFEAAADARNPAQLEDAYRRLLATCERLDGGERW